MALSTFKTSASQSVKRVAGGGGRDVRVVVGDPGTSTNRGCTLGWPPRGDRWRLLVHRLNIVPFALVVILDPETISEAPSHSR